MALDLGALESTSGELHLDCSLIDPDPTQPRDEFDEARMAELVGTMRDRMAEGLPPNHTPVSVKAHPEKPGRWMLNAGERRWRGAQLAGSDTVLAMIDEKFRRVDQATENTAREPLTPRAIANVVAERRAEGMKDTDIARVLGIDSASVTYHAALIDPPASIAALYNDGRCRSIRMLYEIRRLHRKHATEVDAWAGGASDVTMRDVKALRARLEPPKAPSAPPALEPSSAPERATKTPVRTTAPTTRSKPARAATNAGRPAVRHLVVRHGDREAVAVLSGSLVLRFEDGTEVEADAADVVLERVDEG